jgi:hypothetical protein
MGCTSDGITLGMEIGNPKSNVGYPRTGLVLYLVKILVDYIHIKIILLLLPNSKIKQDKYNKFKV